MSWRGRVDGEIDLEIRGSVARVRHLSGQAPNGVRADFGVALPRRDVSIRVERLRGRGRVEVIQQPSSSNGFTAVIRINDSAGGADDYEIEVSWN
jgi:hypothetical protein